MDVIRNFTHQFIKLPLNFGMEKPFIAVKKKALLVWHALGLNQNFMNRMIFPFFDFHKIQTWRPLERFNL
jgi:hypothetical protein